MRKLKLQLQISIDGYIAGPHGEMNWLEWNWDEGLKEYVTEITESVDCIILGRKLAEGFIDAWHNTANDPETDNVFAYKMNGTPKVVFSKTLDRIDWQNAKLANGELIDEITSLKKQEGKDIIVYGGGTFVSSLIDAGLIDEFHLFINPTAIGKGMPIFNGLQNFELIKSAPFECGIVVVCYQLKR